MIWLNKVFTFVQKANKDWDMKMHSGSVCLYELVINFGAEVLGRLKSVPFKERKRPCGHPFGNRHEVCIT